GFGGGGFGGLGGGGGFGGGGTIAGGGGSLNLSMPISQGFRPATGYSSGTTGARPGSAFGQLGGGLGGGGLGQLGMTGGQQLGGAGGAGGLGQLGGLGTMYVKTRISGTALGDSLRPVLPAFPDLQARLDRYLSNATGVSGGRNIALGLDGTTLVMRGQVRNDYEKQLAESLALLDPGVSKVRNELETPTSRPRTLLPPPAPSP